jgi:hypothetical protein
MRAHFANILATILIVAAVLALLPAEAAACPQGYFQCGRVCCPNR